MRNGEWQQDALCAQVDGDIFFPAATLPVTAARRICAACEVQTICLQERLDDPSEDEHGFIGGKTVQERKAMRRNGQAA